MPRCIAGLCLLLLAVVAVMAVGGNSPLAPEPPRMPSRPLAGLSAALAPIGPLAEFSPNEENPFVPSGQGRSPQGDVGATDLDPDRDEGIDGGVAGATAPALPRGRAIDADLPACVGRVVHRPSGDQALIIRHRHSERAVRPGDEIAGWRLLVIEPGAARFRAPDGREISVSTGAR